MAARRVVPPPPPPAPARRRSGGAVSSAVQSQGWQSQTQSWQSQGQQVWQAPQTWKEVPTSHGRGDRRQTVSIMALRARYEMRQQARIHDCARLASDLMERASALVDAFQDQEESESFRDHEAGGRSSVSGRSFTSERRLPGGAGDVASDRWQSSSNSRSASRQRKARGSVPGRRLSHTAKPPRRRSDSPNWEESRSRSPKRSAHGRPVHKRWSEGGGNHKGDRAPVRKSIHKKR